MVQHLELQGLVPLEVVVEDEGLHEVRVQIVKHHLRLIDLAPLALFGVIFRVECHRRICLAYVVYIVEIPARDKQLHLNP